MNMDIYKMTKEEAERFFEKQILNEIAEIKGLLKQGKSRNEIIFMDKFSKEALEKSGVGLSTVVPREEPQALCDEYDYSIPNEGKFEYSDGVIFFDKYQRDSLLLYMLGNAGLKRTVKILPEESKEILKMLLND